MLLDKGLNINTFLLFLGAFLSLLLTYAERLAKPKVQRYSGSSTVCLIRDQPVFKLLLLMKERNKNEMKIQA